jgi:hypothetical protein
MYTVQCTDPARVADPHYVNADPDPAFQFHADQDQAFHFNVEPAPHQSAGNP